MKIGNQSIILLSALPFFLLACNKDENPPISQDDMWDCHHEIEWDSLNTKNILIGEWEWEYISCFWNSENANGNEFKGMTIEFKTNSTLEVKKTDKSFRLQIGKL